MVSGQYGPNAQACSNQGLAEDDIYCRPDFPPAPDATSSATAPSFLVRLRRTNNFQGLDDNAPVSSNNLPIPLLFGRVNASHSSDTVLNPNGYSPRRDGITVRATAIADAKIALSVGAPASGIPGVTPFALMNGLWGNGPITLMPPLVYQAGMQVGVLAQGIETVGSLVSRQTMSSPAFAAGTFFGYVPIYDYISTVQRVIGFAYVKIDVQDSNNFVITQMGRQIAAGNARSIVAVFPDNLSQADLTQILQLNQALGLLRTPALVR